MKELIIFSSSVYSFIKLGFKFALSVISFSSNFLIEKNSTYVRLFLVLLKYYYYFSLLLNVKSEFISSEILAIIMYSSVKFNSKSFTRFVICASDDFICANIASSLYTFSNLNTLKKIDIYIREKWYEWWRNNWKT